MFLSCWRLREQDWSYVDQQCLEVTLELSEHKHPVHSSLSALFDDNVHAMMTLPWTAAWSGARLAAALCALTQLQACAERAPGP